METTKYHAELKFTEPLLGVVPKNPEVYAAWVAIKAAAQSDEVSPDVTEEHSWTGFPCDEEGLFLWDYQVKGYFKEAASVSPKALGKVKKDGSFWSGRMVRSWLDKCLFILPRRIYLGVKEPAGCIERPLRASTLQGDRIALARSDYVAADTTIEFDIVTLVDSRITEKALREWLDYGEFFGIGQFRTGGWGRFVYTLMGVL